MRFSFSEIMICVLAVAILGVPLLRLVLLAERAEQKAAELNETVRTASALVDTFKSQTSIYDFLSDDALLPYERADSPDGALVLFKYFTEDWQPTAESDDAYYQITLTLWTDQIFGPSLYNLHVQTSRNGPGQPVIATMSGVKYFGV